MLYKPKFCCNCGEKIQRAEWNLLTSRRFCEVCSAENKKHDLLPRITVGAGALAAVFGFGMLFGGNGSGAKPATLLTTSSAPNAETPRRTRNEPVSQSSTEDLNREQNLSSSVPEPQMPPPQTADRRFAIKTEQPAAPAFYCGARTKKGTPCSRRVKVLGSHCWQHEAKDTPMPEN